MGNINKKAVTAATEHGKEMCVYNTNLHEIIVHALRENVKSNFERRVKILGTEFSTRLTALRKNAGLNQRELAERIDLSTSSISYYEIGKRSPDINGLRRLSIFFNVSADYLLGLSNAKTNDKDLQAICDYTGLSQIAVATLHASSNVKFNQFINDFILFVAQQ